MPLKIDLDKGLLMQALEAAVKAQVRIKNTTKEPQFIPIVEATIEKLNVGMRSISEFKEPK